MLAPFKKRKEKKANEERNNQKNAEELTTPIIKGKIFLEAYKIG